MKTKPKKIYVLIYNEFDGGGEDYITETVIASLSKKTIEDYKKDLEEKSSVIQNKLSELEEKERVDLAPLWEELQPILWTLRVSNVSKLDKNKLKRLLSEKERLSEATRVSNEKHYKEKSKFLNNINMPYYIDDPDLASFTIDELEII
jgi:GTPase involved in cell partitioning and DNA repair